jgi:lysophospholipase L1-like esterase
MRRKLPLLGLVVVAVVAAVIVVRPAVSAVTPVRIMPLGDSITAGPGCWRALLWNHLQTTGRTNIDFVGTQSDGGGCNPGFPYDFDHEGHGGFSATGIADNNQLPPWLSAARPDVILVHLGTNDMWGGFIPLATKLAAFTKLVGQMRANNPNVKIIVAQIIPMSQAACATCPADVMAFNNAIPGWAAGLTTAQSPITVADLWTGFDAVADTVDGVHPNAGGFQKMADRWYPALAQVLDRLGTPTSAPPTTTTRPPTTTTRPPTTTTTRPPSTTSRPPTTTTTTSGGQGGCSATYARTNEWAGGFQGDVRVTNTGTTTTTSWTVTLTFANGQRITQVWNARTGSTASPFAVTNEAYNNALGAGASTNFGFLGSWSGVNADPTVSCARTP